MKWEIRANRRAAVLYLQWEFGTQRANELIKALPRDPYGRVTLPSFDGPYKTKGQAERWAHRACCAASYQEGRLGYPFRGGFFDVVRSGQ